MKRFNGIFYAIIVCVAFIALGGGVFAADEAEKEVYWGVLVKNETGVDMSEAELKKIAGLFRVTVSGGKSCTSNLSGSPSGLYGNRYLSLNFLGCADEDLDFTVSHKGSTIASGRLSDTEDKNIRLTDYDVLCYVDNASGLVPANSRYIGVSVAIKNPIADLEELKAAEKAVEPRFFLAVIKVTGDEELGKRFALELDNPVSGEHSAKESVGGGVAQIIGKIVPDTTFKVIYTYPDGKKVDVVTDMRAWIEGDYPEFEFNPPVKVGDDSGPRHSYKLSLRVYVDPYPGVKNVQDGLLEVTVLPALVSPEASNTEL